MSIEYAIIVKNRTRLESLIERFNTKAQAKFYIERSGGDFRDYELEDDNFHRSLDTVQRELSRVIKNKIVERSFLPSFLFNNNHVIVVVGQDGLVANTAKYVGKIPIVAVNPDPLRFDGVLLPFNPKNFVGAVEGVVEGLAISRSVTLAEARLNDGQRLLGFNDLFIGASSHVSARYRITFDARSEEHSSSGIIVSTKTGSTGWLSSVFNMTTGMRSFLEHRKAKRKVVNLKDNELMFVVREPFQSKKTQTDLTTGVLAEGANLVLESIMPANGIVFSDGIEADFLNFNSGAIATIGTAEERANLVMPSPSKTA
jgi:NAD kinase